MSDIKELTREEALALRVAELLLSRGAVSLAARTLNSTARTATKRQVLVLQYELEDLMQRIYEMERCKGFEGLPPK